MAFNSDVVDAFGIFDAIENAASASASFRLLHAKILYKGKTAHIPWFRACAQSNNKQKAAAFSEIGIKLRRP